MREPLIVCPARSDPMPFDPMTFTAGEADRLSALAHYDVLDTPAEEAFDRITRIARSVFRTPIATVTLIDGHRQWFKSVQGLETKETPRGPAFCSTTVQRAAPLIVRDAAKDPTFAANPFVVGEPHIRFYAGAPLRTPAGHVIGALCIIDHTPREFDAEQTAILCDLADVVVDELELRQLANVDGLTGALSRRAFRDEAGRMLHLATRHEMDLSLIAFDLDRFKAVNDTYGHPVGDAVLAGSVRACLKQLRKSDIIGRLGGEEFAIALPHTGAAATLDVAEKLRQAISQETYQGHAGAFGVSASFGVASCTPAAFDIDVLLREADTALYAAKEGGRNRCVASRPLEATKPEDTRRRVFKPGRILFNDRSASLDCTIRCLSPSGAGLDVSSPAGLPSTFELAIDAERSVQTCRIVAMSERHVEVMFAA